MSTKMAKQTPQKMKEHVVSRPCGYIRQIVHKHIHAIRPASNPDTVAMPAKMSAWVSTAVGPSASPPAGVKWARRSWARKSFASPARGAEHRADMHGEQWAWRSNQREWQPLPRSTHIQLLIENLQLAWTMLVATLTRPTRRCTQEGKLATQTL